MNVDILGTTYKVKLCKLGKRLYGDCNTDTKVIRINRTMGDPGQTLVHEVIHASLFEAGIIHILYQQDGLEEALVRAIEHGLKTAQLIPEVTFAQHVDEQVQDDSQG